MYGIVSDRKNTEPEILFRETSLLVSLNGLFPYIDIN